MKMVFNDINPYILTTKKIYRDDELGEVIRVKLTKNKE